MPVCIHLTITKSIIYLCKPFAQVVFDLPLDQWHGHVESFKGIHYVRVTGNHDPELLNRYYEI